eukprot:PhM_4_TR1715/c0_g1_i2/m.89995
MGCQCSSLCSCCGKQSNIEPYHRSASSLSSKATGKTKSKKQKRSFKRNDSSSSSSNNALSRNSSRGNGFSNSSRRSYEVTSATGPIVDSSTCDDNFDISFHSSSPNTGNDDNNSNNNTRSSSSSNRSSNDGGENDGSVTTYEIFSVSCSAAYPELKPILRKRPKKKEQVSDTEPYVKKGKAVTFFLFDDDEEEDDVEGFESPRRRRRSTLQLQHPSGNTVHPSKLNIYKIRDIEAWLDGEPPSEILCTMPSGVAGMLMIPLTRRTLKKHLRVLGTLVLAMEDVFVEGLADEEDDEEKSPSPSRGREDAITRARHQHRTQRERGYRTKEGIGATKREVPIDLVVNGDVEFVFTPKRR